MDPDPICVVAWNPEALLFAVIMASIVTALVALARWASTK